MQYVCNATGNKIPWAKIAESMGKPFTEGAIVQHLSKLRTRRMSEEKPVPPPLRRSVKAAAHVAEHKEAGHKASRKRKASEDNDNDNDNASSDEGLFVASDNDDSDYSPTPRAAKRTKISAMAKKSKEAQTTTKESPVGVNKSLVLNIRAQPAFLRKLDSESPALPTDQPATMSASDYSEVVTRTHGLPPFFSVPQPAALPVAHSMNVSTIYGHFGGQDRYPPLPEWTNGQQASMLMGAEASVADERSGTIAPWILEDYDLNWPKGE